MNIKKTLLKHRYIFIAILIFCIFLLAYIQLVLNNAGGASNKSLIYKVDNFNDYQLFDSDLNTPITTPGNFETDNSILITGVFPNELNYNSSLGFYTLHQTVLIEIIDGSQTKEIYEFSSPSTELYFGHTPGHAYNILENIYEYRGKEFIIHLYSPYGIDNSTLPTFVIGSSNNIIKSGARASFLTLATSIIIMLLGLFSIFIWAIFKRYIAKGDLTLYYAGIFSIFIAVWTANEQPIISHYLNNSILTAYLSFISLMLVPIGIILFFREICKTKNNPIWNITLTLNYLNLIITTILQILDIADYKDCLFYNQIILFTSVFAIFIYTIYITFKRRTVDGLINFICVVCLYIGYSLYLYKFYVNQLEQLYWGSILVIVYIIVMIAIYIRKSIKVMLKSDQVEFFENLAYKDSLTELQNRLAYDTDIANADIKDTSYIIVMFDLNNLKYFNDVYGHNIGDKYIKDSSTLIKKAFKDLGTIYRIGGDEFCIIMKDKSIFQYETSACQLDTLIYNYNRVSEVLKINIAYGYAIYDPKLDRDIYETKNRADAMMYEKKFFMKQNQIPLI